MILLTGIVKAKNGGISMTGVANFEQCNGKDASNYTYIYGFTLDSNCNSDSVTPGYRYLIAKNSSHLGQNTVNSLNLLAISGYPNIGNFI